MAVILSRQYNKKTVYVVKVRQDKKVINKAFYLALGVNMEEHKELLGLWLSENEGSTFWLGVLAELQNRGVKDIFIACVDGLKGFPEAINTAFPETLVRLCIVHMVRNSLKYGTWKDYKAVTSGLKQIYLTITNMFGDNKHGRLATITKHRLREFNGIDYRASPATGCGST